MITTTTTAFQPDFPLHQKQPDSYLSYCNLIWRQQQLLVRLFQQFKQPYLPSLESEQLLVDCLKRSPVRLVRLDLEIGEIGLRLWADACKKANKAVFLRLPPTYAFRHSSFSWFLKRLSDWSVAALLLLLLSPLMLGLIILIRINSPGPVFFQQWRVGKRGKLFQIFKFRTMVPDAEKLHHHLMANQNGLHKLKEDPRLTPLGSWMRKYSLDELPQLLNVLRGEMSLVGPRPWALYDAIRLSPEVRTRLNALPGITGAWQVQARSTLADLEAVNNLDLEYLRNWSIYLDLKILLLTVPKVFSGFGAY